MKLSHVITALHYVALAILAGGLVGLFMAAKYD